jgi:hypothetical protein|tara:strand:- start:349 stop:489 length:141 start_codon:yes stop_codon:yes gene_type:complete
VEESPSADAEGLLSEVVKQGGKSKHFYSDLQKIIDKLNPENQDQKI